MRIDFGRVVSEATPFMLEGMKVTVLVSVLGILFGVIIGLLSCFMGRSRIPPLRWLSGVYIWIIRGTPMVVQAYLIYLGVPQLIQMFVPGFRLDALTASIITLTLNAGAYLSEIFRGGISAVPKGQTEAARSLGLSSPRTMLKVVLPQAIKISIPSMVNQFIITIKDSSILSVISLPELTNKTKLYAGSSLQFFASWLFVALFYLIIISVLMMIAKQVEKRMSYERKN